MGERNWYERYQYARQYADEQAAAYKHGEVIENWRQVSETDKRREKLTGAAWVAWAYEIAASNAEALTQTQGEGWRYLVKDCKRLMEEYHVRVSIHNEQ